MRVGTVAGGKRRQFDARKAHGFHVLIKRDEIVLQLQLVVTPGGAAQQHGIIAFGQTVGIHVGGGFQRDVMACGGDDLFQFLGDALGIAGAGTKNDQDFAHDNSLAAWPPLDV